MKKLLTTFVVMLITLFTLTINTYAYTYSIKLSPAKNSLKPGDKVTVDINVDSLSLDDDEYGIIGFEADLEYDDKTFSKVSVSGEGSWTEGENIKKVKGIFQSNEIKQTGKIATLLLTVAEDATLGNTKITLKNIQTANGASGVVKASNTSANLLVVDVVDDGNTDNGNNPSEGNNQGNGNNNSGSNNNQGSGNNNSGSNNNQGNGNNNSGSNNNQGNGNNNSSSNNNQGNGNNNSGTNQSGKNNNISYSGTNTSGLSKNNTNQNTSSKDNTKTNKVISAAGLENTGVMIFTIFALVGIAYISYKKYKSM